MRRSSEANRRTSSAPRDEKVGLIVICFKTCQIVFQALDENKVSRLIKHNLVPPFYVCPYCCQVKIFSQINNVIFFDFLTEIGLIGQPKREVSNLKRLVVEVITE